MRKVSDLFTGNSKLVDKKIQKLYQDLDIDKFIRMIERKMNKDEGFQRFEDHQSSVVKIDKGLSRTQTDMERLEVSNYQEYQPVETCGEYGSGCEKPRDIEPER